MCPHRRNNQDFNIADAHPDRPSLEELLEEYWQLMPKYQGVELDHLQVQRVVFGLFPTYRNSPLAPQFDRLLQVTNNEPILHLSMLGALALK